MKLNKKKKTNISINGRILVVNLPMRRGNAKAQDLGKLSVDGEGAEVIGISGELSSASNGFDAAPNRPHDLSPLLIYAAAHHHQLRHLHKIIYIYISHADGDDGMNKLIGNG